MYDMDGRWRMDSEVVAPQEPAQASVSVWPIVRGKRANNDEEQWLTLPVCS